MSPASPLSAGPLRAKAAAAVREALARRGWRLSRLDADGRRYILTTYNDATPLPDGAAATLTPDNPALTELSEAYERLDVPAVAHSQWNRRFVRDQVDLPWFRGDNAYVWQYRAVRGSADAQMYLRLLDVASRDELGLLGRLDEDGQFGAWLFRFGERAPVSRDLLDSVNEINYLQQRTGLVTQDDLSVLDIGAGYGRLAHRMSTALPNLRAYDCIDGVAASTFLCQYYLNYREVPASVRVVRLDEHQKLADDYRVAVNIHSFSECTRDAIRWWLEQIAARSIEWLLIVPNGDQLLSTEQNGQHLDFRPLIAEVGYDLVDERPYYQDAELAPLIGSNNRFFLFRRAPSGAKA